MQTGAASHHVQINFQQYASRNCASLIKQQVKFWSMIIAPMIACSYKSRIKTTNKKNKCDKEKI